MVGIEIPILAASALAGATAARSAQWIDERIDCILDHDLLAAWRSIPPHSANRSPRFEVFATVLTPGIAALARTWEESAAAATLCAALLVCGWIDWRHKVLPDLIVLPLLGLGLTAAAVARPLIGIAEAALGMAVGWCLAKSIAGLARPSGGGMGNGDAKLLAAIGAWVGPLGICVVFLLAAGLTLPFAVRRPKRLLPFGPAISAATLLWLAFGGFGGIEK